MINGRTINMRELCNQIRNLEKMFNEASSQTAAFAAISALVFLFQKEHLWARDLACDYQKNMYDEMEKSRKSKGKK